MRNLSEVNASLKEALLDLSGMDFDPTQLIEGINDPYIFKALFTAGGPGSGKTYMSNHMVKGLGLKAVNSDLPLERMLKKMKLPLVMDQNRPKEYAAQTATREKAKRITRSRQALWVEGMLGLVIDGTGKNATKIIRQAEALRSAGYDVGMLFVNTPLSVALERNANRERVVPEELVKKMWEAVQKNISKFQSYFGPGNFFMVNSEKTLDGAEEQAFGAGLRREGMKWLRKPVQNPVGKHIISTLKKTGGKTLGDLAKASTLAASKNRNFLDGLMLESKGMEPEVRALFSKSMINLPGNMGDKGPDNWNSADIKMFKRMLKGRARMRFLADFDPLRRSLTSREGKLAKQVLALDMYLGW